MTTVAAAVVMVFLSAAPGGAQTDIVVYSSDATTFGQWTRIADAQAAGGQYMSSTDVGWSTANAPLVSPTNYFEATVAADPGVSYRVWVRLRAASNSKWNDSVWVQFSDSTDASGSALYRIGTTSGLLVNLEACRDCGLSGWGWMGGAYWLTQTPSVRFAASGTHTIRIQAREDGVQVDQIVLSPVQFLGASPGRNSNDTTIVPKPGGGSTPYGGIRAAIPGSIQLRNFDDGGEGVAYHDTTAGNTGGAYRSTDVDLQTSSEGGHNLGWLAPGEWLNYSVDVSAAGSYTAAFRVANPGAGGTFHLEMNGINVTGPVAIPATGGWQVWQTVSRTVSLAAGAQRAKLVFDATGSGGGIGNVTSVSFTSAAGSGGSTPFHGSPASIPGTVQAEDFDNGGSGVAYGDTTPGNNGSVYRQNDVDIQAASGGGYNVGWTAAGEWMNYGVTVAAAGSHTVQLRVASPGGGSLHLGFNGSSAVWQSVNIPATGGWQIWTVVPVPVTLGAGSQLMTLVFDTGGFNVDSIAVVSGAAPPPPPPPSPPPPPWTTVVVATWNVQVNDSSATRARAVIDRLMDLSPRPQVIVMQEGHNSQLQAYLSQLQSRTGVAWEAVFKTHCPPGAWTGSSCSGSEDEGVGILSSFPILNTSGIHLPHADQYHSARATVRAAIDIDGVTTQVFSMHLPVTAAARYGAMSTFRTWSSGFSTPQLVGGDFNADPDQIDTAQGMGGAFIDAWQIVGVSVGYTAFTPNPTMKLDYWFSDVSGKAQSISSTVVTSMGTFSDHFPVTATFTLRP